MNSPAWISSSGSSGRQESSDGLSDLGSMVMAKFKPRVASVRAPASVWRKQLSIASEVFMGQ